MTLPWLQRQALAHEPALSCEHQDGKCSGATHSRLLKRQRSLDKVYETRKKSRQDSAAGPMPSCPLLVALREYGLVENILSCLCPDDLLALLLCSKSTYQTLLPQSGSLENLLGKLRCSGEGVRIRKKRHVKSSFFYAYECSEYVECGAIDGVAESRPCESCKVTTCNECRIHCVYQSIFEKPCEEDELPNYSGFILLSPSEVPIMSPRHLGDDPAAPHWQAPSPSTVPPYHDQGLIDVPLEEESFGPPECVEDFLDLDLGIHTFAASVSSNVAHPSPALRTLYQTTEGRKRMFCDNHLPQGILEQQGHVAVRQCQCSLRRRFLDRWLCLRCYEKEETTLSHAYVDHVAHCCCGSTRGREICMWCFGEISQPRTEDETQPDSETSPNGADAVFESHGPVSE